MRRPPGLEPFTVAPNSRWWLAGPENLPTARLATAQILDPGAIPAERLLKSGTRRLVFALPDARGAPERLVKAFPLSGVRVRLKAWKYAPSEAGNLMEAARRRIPVPATCGWGEERRHGLVVWNAVLMERIQGRNFAEVMGDAADDEARRSWLDRTTTLLSRVFVAACNHIDLKPEALIFADQAAADRVIDFQYCRFQDRPRIDTWMAQAGHFAYWWDRELNPDPVLVDYWLESLFQKLEIPPERASGARAVLTEHRARVRSIADRLRQ